MNLIFTLEISLLCLMAAASPGPNFFMTLSNTLKYGKNAGIRTALGVGVGVTLWLLLCGFGLSYITNKYASIKVVLNISAAILLFYLGIKLIKNPNYKEISGQNTEINCFKYGFIGTVLNGGVGVFYGIIFAKIFDFYGVNYTYTSIYAIIFNIIEMLWFIFVALCASFASSFIHKYAKYINITMGIIMIYFGVMFLV